MGCADVTVIIRARLIRAQHLRALPKEVVCERSAATENCRDGPFTRYAAAMRIFIVVAKDRPDLFRYFTAAFAGVETVQVIVDRRLEQGQALPGSVVSSHQERHAAPDIQERHAAPDIQERRAAPDIYDELRDRGFVIVRMPG